VHLFFRMVPIVEVVVAMRVSSGEAMRKNLSSRLLILPLALLMASTCLPGTVAATKKGDTPLQDSERQLRDLSEAVHHAKRGAVGLVIECQRENDVMGGEIDFIGTDIIPIIPATAEGFGGMAYLPPRYKYLALHMNQLGSVLPLLQSEIDTLQAPDQDQADVLKGPKAEMQNLYADIQKHFTALGPLTTTQPFDTNSIVSEATAIGKDLDAIEKLKKDVYKSYRHDPDKGMGAPVTGN
jgi:hypothetical protein